MLSLLRLSEKVRATLPLVCLVACAEQSVPSSTEELKDFGVNPVTDTLTFAVLSEHVALGKPFGIVAGDSLIWLADASGDPFVHALDARSGRLIVSRGVPGSGPGDFRSASNVFLSPDGQSVRVFDVTSQRITRVSVSSTVALQPSDIQSLPRELRVSRLARFRTGYVGWTRDSARRFVMLDSAGQLLLAAHGELLGDATVPDRQRMLASANLALCSSPNAAKFAVVYTYARRVEVRDSLLALVALAKVTAPSSGDFRQNSRGETVWRRSQFHYRDCVASATHIYALYSGEKASLEVPHGASASTGSATFLEVFDWNGAPVATFKLPVPVNKLAMSPNYRMLFFSSADDAKVYAAANPLNPADGELAQ